MSVRDLKLRFLGDDSDLRNSVKSAGDATDQLAKKTDNFGRRMKNVYRFVAGGLIVGFAKQLFDAGAQAEAFGRRFDTVFGDAGSKLGQFIEDNNRRFGVAEERLQGMAAAVGDLLVPMGMTRDRAAEVSQEVLILSGALSEWSGGVRNTSEVSDILTKALLGEREPLKSLGVSLTEAELSARLAEKGLDDLTGTALAQAKAMESLEIITEKSADAMAAYEDGGTDAMRASNDFKAALDELTIQAGEAVIKLAPLIGLMADIAGAVPQVGTAVDSLESKIRGRFGVSMDEVSDLVDKATDRIMNFGRITSDAEQTGVDALVAGMSAARDAVDELSEAADTAASSEGWDKLAENSQGAVDKIVSMWQGLPEQIEDAAFDVESAIANALETRELADEFRSGLETLASLGLSGVVHQLETNPNRQQAVAAIRVLLDDLDTAFDLEEALTGKVADALTRFEADLKMEQNRFREINDFFATQGADAATAYWDGFASVPSQVGSIGKGAAKDLRLDTIRGGAQGFD